MEFYIVILVSIDILYAVISDYFKSREPKGISSLEFFLFMYDFKDELDNMLNENLKENEQRIEKAREMQQFYDKMKGNEKGK